jgi:hypothetical protein
MKILCTGNLSKTIPYSLSKLFPDIDFISRSNGYDLDTSEGRIQFKNIIIDYDVFINHSELPGDGQCELLHIAHDVCTNIKVINIGTVLELEEWAWYNPNTHIVKNKLKKLSLSLNSEKFKTTHLIIGGLASIESGVDHQRLNGMQVAEVIKYIIDSPINIPLMHIENTNDELMQHYMNISSKVNVV